MKILFNIIDEIEILYFPTIISRMISYFTVKNKDNEIINIAIDKLDDLNNFTR